MIDEYDEDDQIYLFGFSRGAYTARSLAGLIGLCGIPPRGNGVCSYTLAEHAYRIYRTRDQTNPENRGSRYVDDYNSLIASVHFIGVWDTVGTLGMPIAGPIGALSRRRNGFHDVSLGPHIRHAYHALAINERRGPFKPALWSENHLEEDQEVRQTWFPGVHSNIGGGYVDTGLSDRTLLWMIYHANRCGLNIDERYIDLHVHPNWFGELRKSETIVYKMILWNRPQDRCIGPPETTTQSLHKSVEGRWKAVTSPDAIPRNVVRVFGRMQQDSSDWEGGFNLGARTPLSVHTRTIDPQV